MEPREQTTVLFSVFFSCFDSNYRKKNLFIGNCRTSQVRKCEIPLWEALQCFWLTRPHFKIACIRTICHQICLIWELFIRTKPREVMSGWPVYSPSIQMCSTWWNTAQDYEGLRTFKKKQKPCVTTQMNSTSKPAVISVCSSWRLTGCC